MKTLTPLLLALILATPLLFTQCSKNDNDDTPGTSSAPAKPTQRIAQSPPLGMKFPRDYFITHTVNDFKAWYRNTDITTRTTADKVFEEAGSVNEVPTKLIFLTPKKMTVEGELDTWIDVFFANDTLFIHFLEDPSIEPIPFGFGDYRQFTIQNYRYKIQKNNEFSTIDYSGERVTRTFLLEEAQRLQIENPDTIAYWNNEFLLK